MIDFSRFGIHKGKHPLDKAGDEKMVRDAKTDVTEELGCPLSSSERVRRVYLELEQEPHKGNLTSRDIEFLRSNNNSKWLYFSPKQEVWMQDIEKRVFGEKTDAERREEKEEEEQERKELDGQLHFHKKTRR